MNMSDLGNTLIILGFEARTTLLNKWLFLRIFLMLLDKICMLVALAKYSTLIIFRYDFDWGNLGDWTCLGLTLTMLLTYCSMAWRSNKLVILLVVIIIPLLSMHMKLVIVLDLMFLMCEGPLVIMFNLDLGLSCLLIIFWTISIYLFWSLGKAFLILSVSLAILETLVGLTDTCA